MRSRARAAVAMMAACFVLGAAIPVSTADDSTAFRDLATGADFRLRVAAALALGKSTSPGARAALEKALGDPHPAVRAAAAAALGALGDGRSIPALKAALAGESAANVKAQIEQTLKRLTGASSQTKTKFLVQVGKIENKSGVSAATIAPAFKASTRQRMALVPGVEVLAEGDDPAAAGKSRGLPSFMVDGSLTQLSKKQGADGVGYAARVEFLIRRMPDQTLKGTMSGAAAALADAQAVKGQSELSQLQVEAVAAAVDTALKGATPALEAAMK